MSNGQGTTSEARFTSKAFRATRASVICAAAATLPFILQAFGLAS